ncbi:MAG: hypothetical protein WBC05_17055 [Sedimentisphaerales bacterium]
MICRIALVVLFLSNFNGVSFAQAKPVDEPNAQPKQNRIIPDLGIECSMGTAHRRLSRT